MKTQATFLKELKDKVENLEVEKEEMKLKIEKLEEKNG